MATKIAETQAEIQKLEAERSRISEQHAAARRRSIELVQQRATALTDAALQKKPVGLKAIDDEIKKAEGEADDLDVIGAELTARIDALKASLQRAELADLIAAWPTMADRYNTLVKNAIYLRNQLVLKLGELNDLYVEADRMRERIGRLANGLNEGHDVLNAHPLIVAYQITGRRGSLGVSDALVSSASLKDPLALESRAGIKLENGGKQNA